MSLKLRPECPTPLRTTGSFRLTVFQERVCAHKPADPQANGGNRMSVSAQIPKSAVKAVPAKSSRNYLQTARYRAFLKYRDARAQEEKGRAVCCRNGEGICVPQVPSPRPSQRPPPSFGPEDTLVWLSHWPTNCPSTASYSARLKTVPQIP